MITFITLILSSIIVRQKSNYKKLLEKQQELEQSYSLLENDKATIEKLLDDLTNELNLKDERIRTLEMQLRLKRGG